MKSYLWDFNSILDIKVDSGGMGKPKLNLNFIAAINQATQSSDLVDVWQLRYQENKMAHFLSTYNAHTQTPGLFFISSLLQDIVGSVDILPATNTDHSKIYTILQNKTRWLGVPLRPPPPPTTTTTTDNL